MNAVYRTLFAILLVGLLAVPAAAQSVQAVASDVQIMPVLTALSADAATDRTSEVIDTKGYARVCIIYHAGPQHNSSVCNIFLQHADVASNETTLTSGADVLGSSQTIAGDDDGEVKYIEFKPTKRFYQLTVNKDATNATNESCVALLYGASRKPVTHAAGGTGAGTGTGAVAGEVLGSASSGTQ
jgi:hypothetical protein